MVSLSSPTYLIRRLWKPGYSFFLSRIVLHWLGGLLLGLLRVSGLISLMRCSFNGK